MHQQLTDHLDKGASLGRDAACLTVDGSTLTYGDVQDLSYSVARALQRAGVRAGEKVAILSSNDPYAFACVFGISRAGAVWCPVNPRNTPAENAELLDAFDAVALIYQSAYAEVASLDLPQLRTRVCLDDLPAWLEGDEPFVPVEHAAGTPSDRVAMLVGTGGTTGRPKGVLLSAANLEAMSAITLMSYPFTGRPVYLALAPLTHAAGVLCFPVMDLGGEVVVMRSPDLGVFLDLVGKHAVTHAFLPPTLVYMLLDHPHLATADLSSLQCLWYGAAPMSAARLEQAVTTLGPVLGQLYGQSEAPMMISTLAPADHVHPDGTLARERFSSAGKPSPLVTVGIVDDTGALLPAGGRGEIVARGSLVMQGYYKNPDATAAALVDGWLRTGDIGYLDADGYLFVVDRAKDMIITGGFNVYSAEVEQALSAHPAVQDCAVVGLPDDKWGERVEAVVQLRAGQTATEDELRAFAKARLGSVKAPKHVHTWPDLPRSRVGKVLKTDVRAALLAQGAAAP